MMPAKIAATKSRSTNKKGTPAMKKVSKSEQYQNESKQVKKHGTKKQIRAYELAKWNAYPDFVKDLLVRHGSVRMGKSVWERYHRIGFRAARKAGFKMPAKQTK